MCVQLLCPSVFPASSRQSLSLLGHGSEERGSHHEACLPLGDLFPCDSAIQGSSCVCSVGRLLRAFLGKEEGGEARLCSELDHACARSAIAKQTWGSPMVPLCCGQWKSEPSPKFGLGPVVLCLLAVLVSPARRSSQRALGTGRTFSEVSLLEAIKHGLGPPETPRYVAIGGLSFGISRTGRACS